MPGEASLKAGQYYAHPRNAFWHIMGELFGAGPSLPYQERVAILKSVGVALWDSLQACIRPGSLDASIKEEVANDFPALFAKYPKITHVFFNGSTAERSFLRHVKPALSEDRHNPDFGEVNPAQPCERRRCAHVVFVWSCESVCLVGASV